MSKKEHLYTETKKALKNQIIESIKKRTRKPLKEQWEPGGTLWGNEGCQMCPIGADLLEYGSDWGGMIFTEGQNAGQVTCAQSDQGGSGGGEDQCPNWGVPTPFNNWGQPDATTFPNTDQPNVDSNAVGWGCPYGYSTWGGDCETPIAGGYMCPVELFPMCCHSYVPGDHQYDSVNGPHPSIQGYLDYCANWAPGDEEGLSDKKICYTCKGGSVVGQKFGAGAHKGYDTAECPPGWFETQEEAQANCGDTGGGRLMGKQGMITPMKPVATGGQGGRMTRPMGRMNEQVERMQKLAGIKKKK